MSFFPSSQVCQPLQGGVVLADNKSSNLLPNFSGDQTDFNFIVPNILGQSYQQQNAWLGLHKPTSNMVLPRLSQQDILPASYAASPLLDLQAVASLCALRNSMLAPTLSKFLPRDPPEKNGMWDRSTTPVGSELSVPTMTSESCSSGTGRTMTVFRDGSLSPCVKRTFSQSSCSSSEMVKKSPTVKKPRRKTKRRIKYCKIDGCMKYAQGGTDFCVAHGGGRRCTYPGCSTGARGSTKFCILHGGGKRCHMKDCTKSAIGSTNFCIKHGGGRRCKFEGCKKAAQGATNFCVRHGGGRKCEMQNCSMNARARSRFCRAHWNAGGQLN